MEPPKLVENAGTNLKAEIAAHMDGIARLIDAEWKRLHEREEQLAKERAAFEEMRAKIASVHVPDRIKLCVGGTVFATSREHLMRDPESMLAAMFSGRGFKAEPDADGTYFIDRDRTLPFVRRQLTSSSSRALPDYHELPPLRKDSAACGQ